MQELKGSRVVIRDRELTRRERTNREYLMRLTNDHLLFNYRLEAGRFQGRGIPEGSHTGWESPVCQIRGHFLGHWLSAAALHYHETGDPELKAKADAIVLELRECQKDNGGTWVGPIPEKYLHFIARGKAIWAPQYNLHKLFMGLVDTYVFAGNEVALEVADHFADWFLDWSAGFSREAFDDILDVETGGMLEVWADLLFLTKKDKYKTLLERYYRQRLFQPLLEGKDVLTNMHANTTIPEVLGCARAFEVTGDPAWLAIVKAYWKCAVTDRGTLATGGQTSGEIWMPKNNMKARLGDKNQEHCTVYNMMRLAEFLFRQTGEASYAQYWESNLYNGIMAQAYYQDPGITGTTHSHPASGLLTYFLPMKAGLRKDWAGETDSFFCCHGTMVQANAALNRNLFYQDGSSLFLCQYFDSELTTEFEGQSLRLTLTQDTMSGNLLTSSNTAGFHGISELTARHENTPGYRKYDVVVQSSGSAEVSLNLRIPDWIAAEATVILNGEVHGKTSDSTRFYTLRRVWKDGDRVSVLLPVGLRFVPLPDDQTMGAFLYGPEVLAGLCDAERTLHCQGDVASEVVPENEREWGSWRTFFKTVHQDPGIQLRRIRDIGYEPFQVYFPVRRD